MQAPDSGVSSVRGRAGWSRGEMLAVAAAHQVRDEDVVLVGLGLPQVAAGLAQRTHAPGVRLLLEVGVFEPQLSAEAMGVADPRMWTGTRAYGGMLDVLGYMLQAGRVTLGLLGALQVDQDGSINSSLVVTPEGRQRRFWGSGGGNDVASLAGRVLVVMRHEPRKFKAAVDFVTSPGRRVRGLDRASLGLPGAGTVALVTDRALIEIGERGAVLAAVHPGEELEAVLAATPMPVSLPPAGPTVSQAPTAVELALVRERLDPHGWYTRG